MKKKILLLTLMLALFVCVFAISVNAASSNEFGEVEILSGMSEKSSFGTDGTEAGYTSRVVLYDGTAGRIPARKATGADRPKRLRRSWQDVPSP